VDRGLPVTFHIAQAAKDFNAEALGSARAALYWTHAKIELEHLLKIAPVLEWIHVRVAGVDSLLFPALIESSVVLTNARGNFSQSLGEFVLASALYWAKDFPAMNKAKAERRWHQFEVLELSKQTMGIVGHGDIGRAIARRAKAFGMRVLAVRTNVARRVGDEDVDRVYHIDALRDMLPECDYVAVSVPLTPATRHMLGAAEFGIMKREAVVINVARGAVIDEAAMVDALRNGQIRGAALDVFEVEPLPPESPLFDLENVLLSAHTADRTKVWMWDAMNFYEAELLRWLKGERLHNIVDKRAGY
jgi:phosphoglycerate dehydrogenase-like enzyme